MGGGIQLITGMKTMQEKWLLSDLMIRATILISFYVPFLFREFEREHSATEQQP